MERQKIMNDNPASTGALAAEDAPEFPMPRAAGCPFDPAPELRRLQAEAPVTQARWWDGSHPWLVTRYEDQRALAGDPRVSSDSANPGFPPPVSGFEEIQKQGRTLIRMDDPEHARQRRMLTAWFSVKRAEAMRPAVQGIVDGLIDAMLDGPRPVDLVEALALAVPSLVICELLGVPYDDREFFQESAREFLQRSDGARAAAAQGRVSGYMDRLIGKKLADPDADLMSDVARQVKAGELSRGDAARMGMLLLLAGHETTANMIALGTLALLQHPDQLAILRQAGDRAVVDGTVEELLRYLTIPHNGRPRVALEDIEIGGQVIRAGDGILLPIEIANRDETVFPDPDRLDILRDARHHMAFLFGPHQCLGQNLARVELQVVYGTLFKRIPALRLAAGLDQIPFKHDAGVYGVYELPVTW
jgi:cytochrome P450